MLKEFKANNEYFATNNNWKGLWIESDNNHLHPSGYEQIYGTCDVQGENQVRKIARELSKKRQELNNALEETISK